MKAVPKRYFKGWHLVTVCLLTLLGVVLVPVLRSRAQVPSSTYTITDLGALGGTQSNAYGINNCGSVVGEVQLAGGAIHGFIWRSPGPMVDLGTLGGANSAASAVNGSNFAVGDTDTSPVAATHAFIWRDDNGNSTSDAGEMRDLACGASVQPSDVNDVNQVVGTFEVDPLSNENRGFIWDPATGFQMIPVLDSVTPFLAKGINSSGRFVGKSSGGRAFFSNGTRSVDLGALGGDTSIAYEINDQDYVVGEASYASPSTVRRAFIWHDTDPYFVSGLGEMKDLGTLGETNSIAYDLNATRQVVGSSYNTSQSTGRAFVWEDLNNDDDGVGDPGEMQDLSTMIDVPGWSLIEARSINDVGQIVGWGINPLGQTRAFLLTPTSGFSQPSCSAPPALAKPIIDVAVTPSATAEDGATNLTYTLTRSGTIGTAVKVNFSVGGTASFSSGDYTQVGADTFTASAGSVTFCSGETTKVVTINPTADGAVEPDETVILTITPDVNIDAGSSSQATGTISDDDTVVLVTVAVSPSSVIEDGPNNLVYTFTRMGIASGALTVQYSVGGTATLGVDYTGVSSSTGTVSFASSETTKTVTIDPTVDTTDETDETVILTVTAGTGYNVGSPSSATGTISDDDSPTISITNVTQSEGNAGTSTFVFQVNLSIASQSTVTVNYMTAAGTANAAGGGASCAPGTDYVNASGSLTFVAGDTSEPVSVTVCGDTPVEPDETFFVNLSGNSANSNLPADTKGLGTIANDDTDVTLAVSPASVTEDGAGNLVYTFTRAGITTGTLTVNFSVAGTATFVTDYSQIGADSFTASSGTVTFATGNATTSVTVYPATDSSDESNETVILTLTSGVGYNVGNPGSATGTISNDDAPVVQFSSTSFSVNEGDGVATIAVTRTGDTSGSATVNYSTSDAAGLQSCTNPITLASERCDYTTAVGTVRFAAGESSKTFIISLIDDVWVEGDETFTVSLSNPTGASLGSPASATVTIVDNDFSTPTSNPIDGVEFFIRQMYRDILNRQPDSTGLQNWIDTLAPCPNGGFGEPPTSNCDRLHVASGFFQSEEFLNRGYFAFRFYMVSFNQRPTYAQFIPDMAQVGGPKSPAEEEAAKVAYADAFVQRPEFLALYVGLSGQALADALLQKAGLPAGSYNAGSQTDGQILRGIAESSAAFNKFLTEGTVSILYFGFQRRDPDAIGYQNNLDTLNASPNNLRHMVFIFIYSTEYRNRFGPS